MNRYENTKKFIVDKLKSGLPETLYYHGFHHVLDVLEAAVMIGENEKISNEEMELLKVAVLFHDSGFILDPNEHEKKGCDLVRKNLPGFGYTEKEIESICGMIMVTKYPPHPKNLLEEIICDADLDYLGRDDFFEISNTLYKELIASGAVSTLKEWNDMQDKFLSSHTYFTKTAKELRNPGKTKHMGMIRELAK